MPNTKKSLFYNRPANGTTKPNFCNPFSITVVEKNSICFYHNGTNKAPINQLTNTTHTQNLRIKVTV